MSNKELILDKSIGGFLFEVVNPELIEGDIHCGKKDSVDWDRLQLKDDPLKRDLSSILDPYLLQKVINSVLLSFKEGA
jgi:hypothetical protein